MSTGPASYNLPVNLIAYKANIKKLSERNVSRGASPIFNSDRLFHCSGEQTEGQPALSGEMIRNGSLIRAPGV